MKFTIAAAILLQALPVFSGETFKDTPLSDIETCDPTSNDRHIGKSSCESGYRCIADESFDLGGICVSEEAIAAAFAAVYDARDLQEVMNDTMVDSGMNATNTTMDDDMVDETTGSGTPTPAPGSAPIPSPDESASATLSSVSSLLMGLAAATVGMLALN
jgi:hypothetical protein